MCVCVCVCVCVRHKHNYIYTYITYTHVIIQTLEVHVNEMFCLLKFHLVSILSGFFRMGSSDTSSTVSIRSFCRFQWVSCSD